MIVREGIGFENLDEGEMDWLGPLIQSVTSTGLEIYKGIAQSRAIKQAKKDEEKTAAQEAAMAARAALEQQQMAARQLTNGGSSGGSAGGSGIPLGGWIAIAGGGVVLLGIIGYLLLKSPAAAPTAA